MNLSLSSRKDFIHSDWEQTLSACDLKNFEDFWNLDIDLVDSGNEGRGKGGWSKVGVYQISHAGTRQRIVVKRQQNYFTRTWQHPIQGMLTFTKEFNRLQFCKAKNIATSEVVFFAKRKQGKDHQAILVTAWLDGYRPLDVLIEDWRTKPPTAQLRTAVIRSTAELLSQFHARGLEHRCLYPKHIFIDCNSDPPRCALIDLEKARLSPLRTNRIYRDLSQLVRYLPDLRRLDRVLFVRFYLHQDKLGTRGKTLWRAVDNHSQKKIRRKT